MVSSDVGSCCETGGFLLIGLEDFLFLLLIASIPNLSGANLVYIWCRTVWIANGWIQGM